MLIKSIDELSALAAKLKTRVANVEDARAVAMPTPLEAKLAAHGDDGIQKTAKIALLNNLQHGDIAPIKDLVELVLGGPDADMLGRAIKAKFGSIDDMHAKVAPALSDRLRLVLDGNGNMVREAYEKAFGPVVKYEEHFEPKCMPVQAAE